MMETKLPLPPFTVETDAQKVCLAEDAWNSRDPDRVVLVGRYALAKPGRIPGRSRAGATISCPQVGEGT